MSVGPGAGTVFVVHAGEHWLTAGARIFLDDVLVGTTDADGRLRHAQATRPTRIRVEWTGDHETHCQELSEVKELEPVISVFFGTQGRRGK